MKLMPASSAWWMIPTDVSWSGSPHAPNIMAPRQRGLTCIPVRPRLLCSMPLQPRPGPVGPAVEGPARAARRAGRGSADGDGHLVAAGVLVAGDADHPHGVRGGHPRGDPEANPPVIEVVASVTTSRSEPLGPGVQPDRHAPGREVAPVVGARQGARDGDGLAATGSVVDGVAARAVDQELTVTSPSAALAEGTEAVLVETR